jgi:hypothetical protein
MASLLKVRKDEAVEEDATHFHISMTFLRRFFAPWSSRCGFRLSKNICNPLHGCGLFRGQKVQTKVLKVTNKKVVSSETKVILITLLNNVNYFVKTFGGRLAAAVSAAFKGCEKIARPSPKKIVNKILNSTQCALCKSGKGKIYESNKIANSAQSCNTQNGNWPQSSDCCTTSMHPQEKEEENWWWRPQYSHVES